MGPHIEREQQLERQPLLRSHSSKHGTAALCGKSSLAQTVFNSTNVLLGVGLLSLPLAMRYAGWVLGITILSVFAVLTAYTAKALARCLEVDKSLVTYTDLAFASYGRLGCVVTQVLFSFTMIATCVALVILFGDIMNLMVPNLDVSQWKFVCGVILVPLQFLPFSILSIASVFGVCASAGLVIITCVAGILKDVAPGSLRHPAPTSPFAGSWIQLLLSLGLFMSSWGGHASFPNICRDMKAPSRYNSALLCSFVTTFVVDIIMASCGYLMFGDSTKDQIVANILTTPNQPWALFITIVVLVAVMPITKIPLSSRPLVIMIERGIGLGPAAMTVRPIFQDIHGRGTIISHLIRVGLRIIIVIVIIFLSVACPSFDMVMAFSGSALCTTICVVLPVLFYLKICHERIGLVERVICRILVVSGVIMALAGTVSVMVASAGVTM